MANISPTILNNALPNGVVQVTWTPVTESDTCLAVSFPGYDCLVAQVFGTFGSASIALQGSLDNSNFYAMSAKGGTTAIAITTAGAKTPNEYANYYRPASTGGSSSSLTIVALFQLRNSARSA